MTHTAQHTENVRSSELHIVGDFTKRGAIKLLRENGISAKEIDTLTPRHEYVNGSDVLMYSGKDLEALIQKHGDCFSA